ncbi:MAG: hypothetical protein KDJ29_19640 [Hyphomicrobiales bacterium]|nr:hypothetical protein [Hyphomicrobiales bacterium]
MSLEICPDSVADQGVTRRQTLPGSMQIRLATHYLNANLPYVSQAAGQFPDGGKPRDMGAGGARGTIC